MGVVIATAEMYRDALIALLRRGMPWTTESTSDLGRLLEGLGAELARVHNRLNHLVEEADPRTTVEMLEEWERAFGLPDPCSPVPGSLEERQNILHAKVISRGGQSEDYLLSLASALGYQATITYYDMFRVGISAIGDPIYDYGKAYTFIVAVSLEPTLSFQVGISQVGVAGVGTYVPDRLQLECIINRVKPSHTMAEFSYPP